MKTMGPLGYHQNGFGFVAAHALGHLTLCVSRITYNHLYTYLYIYIYIYI